MNINGQGHSSTFVQGHSDSTFSNFFSLETARPFEAKFHVELPWDRGMKVSTNGLCHMTIFFHVHILNSHLALFQPSEIRKEDSKPSHIA